MTPDEEIEAAARAEATEDLARRLTAYDPDHPALKLLPGNEPPSEENWIPMGDGVPRDR